MKRFFDKGLFQLKRGWMIAGSVPELSLNNTKHRYLKFLLLNNNTIKIDTRVSIVLNFAQRFLNFDITLLQLGFDKSYKLEHVLDLRIDVGPVEQEQ